MPGAEQRLDPRDRFRGGRGGGGEDQGNAAQATERTKERQRRGGRGDGEAENDDFSQKKLSKADFQLPCGGIFRYYCFSFNPVIRIQVFYKDINSLSSCDQAIVPPKCRYLKKKVTLFWDPSIWP